MQSQVEQESAAPDSKPVLDLTGITKSFGMTQALSQISLGFQAGEIHAIVGENGAGKSTLIKIMTGVYHADAGRILLDGQPVAFDNPEVARAAGVAAVYQEPMVFPDLNVAENILICARATGIWLRQSWMRSRSLELVERIGMQLDVDRAASGLTLAEQQAVEIARALSLDVRVLIMDEPTASLSAHEAERLRAIARKLASEGVAVVYISHRLEEVFEIADRVTVLRDGAHVSTRPVAQASPDGVVAEMVGRQIDSFYARAPTSATDETLLEVRGLRLDGVFDDISFALRKGEIMCLAGLVGARRTDVALTLFGVNPPSGGQILLRGQEVAFASVREAMDAGIAYVSEDRRKLGLAMPASITANMTLATLPQFLSPLGLLDTDKERGVAERFRQRLNIRTSDIQLPVGLLSGGNQQKVMLAKWLNMQPDLLIFDEPTRGIDIGAKAEVHELIRQFAASGGGVLMISSDLPEVLAMGDRILVLREGRRMGVLDADEATQEKVMALATGQTPPPAGQ